MSHVGSLVRQLRMQAEMTQEDVSVRADVSRSYLSRLETGEIARPSADFLFRVARAIGVHPDILFEEAGYRGAHTPEVEADRAEALDWLASETATWTGSELRFWAKHMIMLRNAVQEFTVLEAEEKDDPVSAVPA